MDGKKAAIILIGIIAVVSILVVIAISYFFSTYEPKNENAHQIQLIEYDLKKIETGLSEKNI
ncbi:MAG: hypothetical protein GX072_04765 [Lysinibacillus sp.]|nr:hypothetical protein [Lysinibacillus sp.]